MKILLVEDNELNRDMLSRRLVRRGHVVVTAVDGAAAVETTLAEQPDVVLMDLGLPVLDGWEATRRLKSDPRTAMIPVIALTAHAMTEDRERALAAGCDEFDTKPVDLERLSATMAALTRRRRADVSSRPGGDEGVYLATQPADLAGLTAFVDRSCSSVGAGADAAADLRLATEEVFMNILQHGYGDRPGSVTVRIDATRERITVTLTDEATAFDPSATRAPDLAADGEHRALGGLGWHLVRQVMDEVTHEHTAGVGNVFTLVKALSAGPPGSGTR